jgi:hypothetical protein
MTYIFARINACSSFSLVGSEGAWPSLKNRVFWTRCQQNKLLLYEFRAQVQRKLIYEGPVHIRAFKPLPAAVQLL